MIIKCTNNNEVNIFFLEKTFLELFLKMKQNKSLLNQLPKILPRNSESFLWPELICLRLTAFPYSMWPIYIKIHCNLYCQEF